MPKQKPCMGLIPNIYRKSYEDIGMFFWVEAQRNMLPTMTIVECIEKYFKFVGLEWDIECALSTYTRLKKEFLKNG
jgi:hypothetical protein